MKISLAIALTALLLACDPDDNSGGGGSSSETKKPKPPVVQNLKITDPLYKDQWYLKNTGQFGSTPGMDINIEPAWQQGYTGKGMHIAILDEPLGLTEATAHEDLKDRQNFAKSHNYYSYDDTTDNHGLNTAGIIAASGNKVGIRGIAYESKLYTYGIFGSTNSQPWDNAVAAMKRINKIPQIAVVNNSWGEENLKIKSAYRAVLEAGLNKGFGGKGLVHVKGAGNNSEWVNSTLESANNYYGFIVVNSVNYFGQNTKASNALITHKDHKGRLEIHHLTAVGSNLWLSAPGYALMTTAPKQLRKQDTVMDLEQPLVPHRWSQEWWL